MNTGRNRAVAQYQEGAAESYRGAIAKRVVILLASTVMLVAVAGTASSANGADTGKSIFDANCAVCHGQDGHVTATGKALNAADLHSAKVQQLTDAEIKKQIEDGKGNMPPFKSSLNANQVKLLIGYVRTFGNKKK